MHIYSQRTKVCQKMFNSFFQFVFVATEQNDFYRHELDWEMCSIRCLPLQRCIMESRKVSRTEWMKYKKRRGKNVGQNNIKRISRFSCLPYARMPHCICCIFYSSTLKWSGFHVLLHRQRIHKPSLRLLQRSLSLSLSLAGSTACWVSFNCVKSLENLDKTQKWESSAHKRWRLTHASTTRYLSFYINYNLKSRRTNVKKVGTFRAECGRLIRTLRTSTKDEC